MNEQEAWAALEALFQEYRDKYKLSFGLEYSDIID